MFGTLHCNSPTKEAEFVERPYGSLNPGMNSACDRCRAYKVKCTVSGKSCSRCRRLKKTCSFTSVRQRSSQRVWKTDVNSKRQESQSSDRSAQPQTSPSPKDSGNEGEDHIKQRGSISSAHTDRNDGSEKGDPHIADYTSHQLSEASSSLSSSSSSSSSSTTSTSSLPFLADYDQREMSEQRDDLCTCSILPFPFCSSSIHYNSPDAMVRSNIGTPQALPTPPASRDETPQQQQQQLLSNSQSHDPQFEMGPIDTESLDITALASSMYWSQGSFEKTCQCLADVIFALEKLEASCSSGSRAGLDSIVANQKEVIELCRCMLKCSNCMAKRENFILLVFMSERIVVACSRIVTMYRMEDGGLRNANNNNNNNNNSNTHTHNHSGATTVAPSQLACLPGSHLSGTTTDMDMDTQCLAAAAAAAASAAAASSSSPSQPTTSGWQQLLLGDYKINSALEWDHLVRALINFQLRAVRALLGDVKSIGTMILGDAQKESLARAETIVNKLEQDIYII
ncbi:hypothetical protein COCMIDRAFT_92540 [Bipolaris oryzae ATCC 44560]|uniref:Zn(2)-C6 fungal-type domain-containing protein n=1 Tax=Bipolaris oryzae ATCC 44560 TaxID=930090 RepID=W6Z4D0_COCMI|nr:uncharacterized protein COCMIDRAFT_92540 [Bipolaris oryzae ATCC 44560]EUC46612.1 hypothetical protein COCMIDRAFT_92540 [Bipolaris oryzae ATCC 44560]